ncbi:MAG: S9 family peptidase [Acidobacteria bacterium]|nr:S9 family peptidase [Acidobacteriota bacterium]MBS1865331.1 S9 family peptidase [Acidobacteriota bacterium]
MKKMKRISMVAVVCAMASGAGAQDAGKHAITFDDLIKLQRVAEPAISPDGKWVAYTVTVPDMEANRNASNIWLVATSGGDAIQLTQSGKDSSPVWSPDGRTIAFISSRSGDSQVYLLSMDGGEAKPLTKLSTGADLAIWSPDGKMIAFTSGVYPECKDDECNKKKDEEKEKNKVKAHVAEALLYRHWTHWNEGKRSHLFVIAFPQGSGQADGSETAKDLTQGANYDVPPDQRGEASDINFSPDSKEICFTAVTDKVEATSTNGDLFVVPVSGGEAKRITTQPGFDGNPVYSPDGKYIAYRSQLTAGYESDRWRVMLYDRATGKSENLSENSFDRSAENLAWAPDSSKIYFGAENETLEPIYEMAPKVGAVPKKLIDGFNGAVSMSADGKTFVFTRTSLTTPSEVFTAASDGTGLKQVTHQNDAALAKLEMNAPEKFWFEGAEATKVQAMLIRPPHFDAAKKYPLLVLLHGGPQTMWGDSWGYRWNAEVFSGAGYVTLMINRRGSTGYGQKFTDEITNDWGGKAYVDVMKGVDSALAKYPFIDGKRMAAAGGSYGGYMADWIATHTDRFKAIVSHAGIWDKNSMYATEELWFEEHDMQGTPWSAPENYKKWAPLTYAAALGKYKTPTLVIGGERDYRVPYTQSLEFFSALQRQGVPSKLVIFPDEGHWVLKPLNSQFWYKTFLDWVDKYTK